MEAWCGFVCYSMIWHGMVGNGMAWHTMACMAWHGWYGMAWYGKAWYGQVRYGTVWYGMACHHIVRCDTHTSAVAYLCFRPFLYTLASQYLRVRTRHFELRVGRSDANEMVFLNLHASEAAGQKQ